MNDNGLVLVQLELDAIHSQIDDKSCDGGLLTVMIILFLLGVVAGILVTEYRKNG